MDSYLLEPKQTENYLNLIKNQLTLSKKKSYDDQIDIIPTSKIDEKKILNAILFSSQETQNSCTFSSFSPNSSFQTFPLKSSISRFVLNVPKSSNSLTSSSLTNIIPIDLNLLKVNFEKFNFSLNSKNQSVYEINQQTGLLNKSISTSSLSSSLPESSSSTISNCSSKNFSSSFSSVCLMSTITSFSLTSSVSSNVKSKILFSSSVSSSSTSISSVKQTEKSVMSTCKVCGDVASGKYFGALVCVPCKTFFLRYAGEGFSFVCKNQQNCDISLSTRIQCKFCRFKKCIEAGMNRKVRPIQIEPKEGKQLCVVCNDIGNGVHFGVMTCEGCKKFFRRGLNEHNSYICKFDKKCLINPQTRNACRYCRYNKCKKLGMSREAIQMGRPSKILSQHLKKREVEIMEIDRTSPVILDLSKPFTTTRTDVNQNEQIKIEKKNNTSLSSTKSLKLDLQEVKQKQIFIINDSQDKNNFSSKLEIQGDSTVSSTSFDFYRNISTEDIVSLRCFLTDQNILNLENQNILSKITKLKTKNNEFQSVNSIDLNLEKCFWKKKRLNKNLKANKQKNRTSECSSPSITSSDDNGHGDLSQIERTPPSDLAISLFIEQKIKSLLKISENYWLAPFPHDENLLFSDTRHWDIINQIFPNYDRFVQMSEKINRCLNDEYENWRYEKEKMCKITVDLTSDWIKNKVIPAFTVVSVTYCKKVPGFSSFDMSDQIKIIRFGQSPSRILAAVLHWFDVSMKNFKHFLSWRDQVPGMTDRFKQSLIHFAVKIQHLQLDPIEAALLNSLVIIGTDYPDLVNTKVIEVSRNQIISTFRAYATAKYGTPNDRLQNLFMKIPELKKLGLIHHEMTNTKTMMAEEFGERLLHSLHM